MPAALRPDIADTSRNTYVDAVFAACYMEERETDDAWTAADPDRRVRALIAATRALDRLSWVGTRATDNLQWPRSGAVDEDCVSIPWNAVPERVKRAQCEVAYALLAGNYSPDPGGSREFDRVKLGDLEVDYLEHGLQPDVLPSRVLAELRPLLASGPGVVRLLRG